VNGVAFALIAAFCWAFSSVVYKIGVKNVSVFTANFHRSLFATLYFLPIVIYGDYLREITKIDFTTAIVLIASAFVSFYAGDLFYMTALKKAPVSIALPVSSTYPVIVVLLSPLLYGVTLNFNALISAFLIFLAVYIIYGKARVEKISGLGFALLAAISWALAILSLDYLTERLSVVMVAFTRMGLNAVILSLTPKNNVSDRNSIIYAGVFGGLATFGGIYSFITAVKISSSWMVAQASASSPVIGAVLSKMALKERIDLRISISILLVFLAVTLLVLPQ
jgi:DME family drug/metabolite transporter